MRNAQLSGLKKAYSTTLMGKIPNYNYPYSEGVQLWLEQADSLWWCVFEPFTYVEQPRFRSEKDSADKKKNDYTAVSQRRSNPVTDWQRERWVRRYNAVWSRIISAWATILAGENDGIVYSIGLRDGAGLDAVFHLSSVTGWSRPSHDHDYFLRGK